MPRIGADPTQLRAAATQLARTADRLDAIAGRVAVGLRRSGWTGPDAEQFERRWLVHGRRGLRHTAGSLREQAGVLRSQAADQEAASTVGPSRSPAHGSAPGRSPEPPAGIDRLGPAPIASELFHLELAGSVALVGGTGARTIRIDHLPGGNVAVTAGDALGAGLLARAPTPLSGTHARATASGTLQRTWTIPPGELPVLLAALTVEATPLGPPARALDTAAGALDAALGHLGIPSDLDRWSGPATVPEPDVTERLAMIGTAGAVTLGPLRASSEGGVAIGRRHGRHGRGTVLEWSQEASHRWRADWSRALGRSVGMEWDPTIDARIDGRIDLDDTSPERPGPGDRPGRTAHIRLQATAGPDRTVLETTVDLDHSDPAGRRVAAAVVALANGDTRPAAGLVDSITGGGALDWRVSEYRVERSGGSLPASTGLAGASLTGTHERAVRR